MKKGPWSSSQKKGTTEKSFRETENSQRKEKISEKERTWPNEKVTWKRRKMGKEAGKKRRNVAKERSFSVAWTGREGRQKRGEERWHRRIGELSKKKKKGGSEPYPINEGKSEPGKISSRR